MAKLNTAQRRYLSRFVPSMAVYVVVIIATAWIFGHAPPQGALKYPLAAAPALPVLGVIWAMGRYLVEETDEYLRAQLVRACMIAIGVTLAVCTVWGFLENYAGVSRPPLYGVFILFMLVLGVCQCRDKLAGRA